MLIVSLSRFSAEATSSEYWMALINSMIDEVCLSLQLCCIFSLRLSYAQCRYSQ